MKSIHTPLSKSDATNFRLFLDNIGLNEVMIGDFEDINDKWYKRQCLCYAYSEKSVETVAILTHITLKYGSLYEAFRKFMVDLHSSMMHDPYFNWTP